MDKMFALLMMVGIGFVGCTEGENQISEEKLVPMYRIGDPIKVTDGFYADCVGVLIARLSEEKYAASLDCFLPREGAVSLRATVTAQEIRMFTELFQSE